MGPDGSHRSRDRGGGRRSGGAGPSAATQLSHAAQGWGKTVDFEKVKKNYRKDTPYRGGRVWLRGYPDPNGEPWKSYLDECQGRFPMRLASATADLDSDLCGPATRRKWAIPWGSEGESESNEPSPLGIAEGQGLTRIVTGILHSFTVRVTNAHQIHRHPITRDDVGIYVRSGPGTPTFYLNQLGEDLYRVDWLASMSGNYTLQVSVRGFPVKDSPFVVAAEAAYTCAEHTTADGDGLGEVVAGKASTFVIHARDQMENFRVSGGDDFAVSFTGPAKLRRVELNDNKSGSYDVVYTAVSTGKYRVNVKFKDKHILGSPYEFTVRPDLCCGPKISVSGPGAAEAEAGVTARFEIRARDRFGNVIHEGGELFEASLVKGPLKGEIPVRVSCNSDGTYTCLYDVEKAGKYELSIRHKGIDCRYPRPCVQVRPGRTCAASSVIQEAGVPFKVNAGEYLKFNFVAHDAFGNRRPVGGDEFKIIVTSSDDDDTRKVEEAMVVDNGDGTYTPQWKAERLGKFYTSVRLERAGEGGRRQQTSIPDSPFLTTVIPGGMATMSCTAEGEGLRCAVAGHLSKFQVNARDSFGNTVLAGGTAFSVRIFGGDLGEAGLEAAVIDNGNGTYGVEYTLTRTGVYDVHVSHDGSCSERMSIFGSPFVLEVIPGEAYGPNCILQGLHTLAAIAGNRTTIILVAKDKHGNRQLTGGEVFAVDLELIPGTEKHHLGGTPGFNPFLPIRALVADNSDGTYSVSLKLRLAGRYLCRTYHRGVLTSGGSDVFDVLTSVPGEWWAPNCLVQGPGATSATAGACASFEVVVADRSHNRITSGGVAAVSARLTPQEDGLELVPCAVVDQDDGSFFVDYQAFLAGDYTLEIIFNSRAVPELSRTLHVSPGETAPEACTVMGEDGGLVAARVGSKSRFVIEARDEFGNLRDSGGDTFLVCLKMVSSEYMRTHKSTPGVVTDYHNGSYGVSYTPDAAGEYALYVTCTSKGEPQTFYEGALAVAPASPTGRKSLAVGHGLGGDVRAGAPLTCTLVVQDQCGNVVDESGGGGGAIRAYFIGGESVGTTTVCKLPGAGAGVYQLAYRAHREGRHRLAVTVGGEDVAGSPFALNAVEDDIDRAAFSERWESTGRHRERMLWDPDTANGYKKSFGTAGSYFLGGGLEPGTAALVLQQPTRLEHLSVAKQLEVQGRYDRYLARRRATLLHWRINALPIPSGDFELEPAPPEPPAPAPPPRGRRVSGPSPREVRGAGGPRAGSGARVSGKVTPPSFMPAFMPRPATTATARGGKPSTPYAYRSKERMRSPARRARVHLDAWEWGGVLRGEAREIPALDQGGEGFLTHRELLGVPRRRLDTR